jgi:phospholipid/cholesterol/gamma-HCH transport system ATP-binding protein
MSDAKKNGKKEGAAGPPREQPTQAHTSAADGAGEVFIEIRGLHKRFGTQEVLRGVDLTVKRGEMLVLIGPSGEGKTVMMKHVIGLLHPDAGSVVVDGVCVTDLKERELAPVRAKVSMLFQNAALFDAMTVAENVAFPLIESGVRDRKEIAQRV